MYQDVIDVFGVQAEGVMRYVMAYALPIALVFGVAFWAGMRGVRNVETISEERDHSDDAYSGHGRYRGSYGDLRKMRKHGL